NGTVAPASWFQSVQDLHNGLLQGNSVPVQQSTLSDAAYLVFKDQAGNVRSFFDHLGYRRGRFNDFVEDWLSVATAGALTVGTGTSGRWDYSLPTNATFSRRSEEHT